MSRPNTNADPDVFTYAERRAIASLERLARHWPKSLYLFSASGSLVVLKTEDVRQGDFIEDRAHSIFGIPNDGGDPDWQQSREDED